MIPAVSDATGPEPHTYLYPTKPEDEQTFRKKILAMAATELQNYQKPGVAPAAAKRAVIKKGRNARPAKAALPAFEDVDLKILDLSSKQRAGA